MSLSRYREIGKDEIKITLKWDKVAKRIDELIQLENTVHECSVCYCREYCISISGEQLSCDETRKKWLASDEK